jgi:hypothetical protein
LVTPSDRLTTQRRGRGPYDLTRAAATASVVAERAGSQLVRRRAAKAAIDEAEERLDGRPGACRR